MNLAEDPELLALMKDAVFIRVFLGGIETPVEASLREAQKLQNTHRSLLDSVRCIQQHGIEVIAGFIVGFDSDPEVVFDRQVEFIQESAIPIPMVGLLQVLPGTQLYRRLGTKDASSATQMEITSTAISVSFRQCLRNTCWMGIGRY